MIRKNEIAKVNGATVPFARSTENLDDFATTVDVIEEVIEKYKEFNVKFDNICCLYPSLFCYLNY